MADGDERRQVLEFALGDDRYCIDIDEVAEIVDVDEVSPIPDTPDHVRGVMELRGETARVVDPKRLLDVGTTGGDDDTEDGGSAPGSDEGRYVVVLAEDSVDRDGATGWLVDAVHRVEEVDGDDVDREAAGGLVDGVVRRDEGFVVWVSPGAVESAA